MENVTLQELYRNLSEHIKHESEYQIRFEEKLDAILLQTTKHNGRMTKMEEWRDTEAKPLLEDYKENRAQAKGAIKLWTVIWGTLITGIGFAGALYLNKIEIETIDKTIDILQASTYKIEEVKKGSDIYTIKIFQGK